MSRERERVADIWVDREIGGQTQRTADRKKDRIETNRQTDTQTDRKRASNEVYYQETKSVHMRERERYKQMGRER